MSTLPDAVAGRQKRASDSAVRRVSANMASMQQFVDDDAGYLNWITSYPDRFVLNTYRRPTPAYLMLHHASCRTIRARSNWTKDYRKVCGECGELEAFAREEVGGDTQLCSRCF
jgi:hypothetical protein